MKKKILVVLVVTLMIGLIVPAVTIANEPGATNHLQKAEEYISKVEQRSKGWAKSTTEHAYLYGWMALYHQNQVIIEQNQKLIDTKWEYKVVECNYVPGRSITTTKDGVRYVNYFPDLSFILEQESKWELVEVLTVGSNKPAPTFYLIFKRAVKS